MKILLEAIAVLTIVVIPHQFGSMAGLWYPASFRAYPASLGLFSRWISSIASISVILLIALERPDGFNLIGIHFDLGSENTTAFDIGIFVILAVLVLFQFMHKRLGSRVPRLSQPEPQPDVYIEEISEYDNREFLAFVSQLHLGVAAEELVYRGYGVLFLGAITGIYLPWIVLSIVLSVTMHLYQGKNKIVYHLVTSSIFVGLAILTQNLIAPIGGHLYMNLVWAFGLWRKRQQRKNAAMTTSNMLKNVVYLNFILFNILVFSLMLLWALGGIS